MLFRSTDFIRWLALWRSWSFRHLACSRIGRRGGCRVVCALLTCSQQIDWFLGLFSLCWPAVCQRLLVCLMDNRLQFHILPLSFSYLLRRTLSTPRVMWSICLYCLDLLFGCGALRPPSWLRRRRRLSPFRMLRRLDLVNAWLELISQFWWVRFSCLR